MALAEVRVTIADLEPVCGFIAKVLQADAKMRRITAEEAAALPDFTVAGMGLLQEAVAEISTIGTLTSEPADARPV